MHPHAIALHRGNCIPRIQVTAWMPEVFCAKTRRPWFISSYPPVTDCPTLKRRLLSSHHQAYRWAPPMPTFTELCRGQTSQGMDRLGLERRAQEAVAVAGAARCGERGVYLETRNRGTYDGHFFVHDKVTL